MARKRDIDKAIRAARAGEAYHWPTIASILADEVERLRVVVEDAAKKGVGVCWHSDCRQPATALINGWPLCSEHGDKQWDDLVAENKKLRAALRSGGDDRG